MPDHAIAMSDLSRETDNERVTESGRRQATGRAVGSQQDLRSYLAQLETLGGDEFLRVSHEMSPIFEVPAAVVLLERQDRFPALLFEKVRGSELPILTNIFASHRRAALALGVSDSRLAVLRYLELEEKPAPVAQVRKEEAPVKEIVFLGGKADLGCLPIVWHHTLDSGPYVTAGCLVTRDPQTGVVNAGMYRHELRGPRELGAFFQPWSHTAEIFRRYQERRQPMPVAIFIGHHPAVLMACAARVPFGQSELEVAGGLLGAALPVVPAETVDLVVPAAAEIVIEGVVKDEGAAFDGPFGEYTGYYGGKKPVPLVEVTAITMRRHSIYLDICAGRPDHHVSVIAGEANLYRYVRTFVPTLVAVHRPISGRIYHCYLSIKKRVEGQAKVAGMAALTADPNLKHVIVVDEDIDPYNEREVLWALATRFQADRDLIMLPYTTGATLDPLAYGEDRSSQGTMTTKLILDATKPLNRQFPERVAVPEEVVDRIRNILNRENDAVNQNR